VSGSVPFDRAVEYYDRTRGLSQEASRAMASLLAADLHDRGRCLEVGVGTGLVALPLAAAGVPMVGIDISGPMLAKLVEKAGGREPFPLVRADATSLPFADDSFGGAVVRHVLHLVPEWRRVVSEMVRVLSSGGVVLVSRGDIPTPWREATDRFIAIVGAPSFAGGLSAWDPGEMDRAFVEHGASARSLPSIVERVQQSLGRFLDQMAEGLHSWTWEVEEQKRREAAAEVRRWALDRFGTLDPPGSREVAIGWRAYDLP
jgi:ubiquinone/menaquinone biosynthesis C-methylase UbiE